MIDPRPISEFKFNQEEYDQYQAGEEIWRDIEGREGLYQISTYGNIKRLAKQIIRSNGAIQTFNERLLAKAHDKDGYIQLSLSHMGVSLKAKAHRVSAAAFIGDIPDDMEVNHINGIKDDNNLVNLEICTKSQNMLHAYRVLGKLNYGAVVDNNKPVSAYYIKPRKSQKCKPEFGAKFKTFNSIHEAAKFIGKCPGGIIDSIKGTIQHTSGGYLWKYECDLLSLQQSKND